MSHNQADSPKKSPIYIKKCKPNLNLKSHYIGQIEHCFVTQVSLMDINGATKTERTEEPRSWRHLCRTELISWQQPAHSAATPTRAPWTGKSLAAAHREARHGNGGFFMRRRLEGVETGGRLSHDGGARSKKKCLEAIRRKGSKPSCWLDCRQAKSSIFTSLILYYFQL